MAAVIVAILGVTTAITGSKANSSSTRAETLSILVSNVQQSAQSAAVAQTSDQDQLAAAKAQLGQRDATISSLASVASSQSVAMSAVGGSDLPVTTVMTTVTETQTAPNQDPLGPTASAATTASPGPRHAGTVRIANDNYIDLDSPKGDNLWATGDQSDISYYSKALRVNSTARLLVLGSTKAAYASCNTTGYSDDSVDLTENPVGTYICVRTTGRRFAALRVISSTSSMLALDVVTFDPPYSTN